MAASPRRQMPTNSFQVIRNPIAVLTVAPFSPDRDFKRFSRHSPAKGHLGSIVQRTGAGFESLEPASPAVGCLGQIKLKQKWAKSSKDSADNKPGRTTKGNFLSKITKFIFGSHGGRGQGQGECGAASRGDYPTEDGCRTPYPLLGQLKRYASSSYDEKFSDIYTRSQPFVDPLGSPYNGSIGRSG